MRGGVTLRTLLFLERNFTTMLTLRSPILRPLLLKKSGREEEALFKCVLKCSYLLTGFSASGDLCYPVNSLCIQIFAQ